MSPTSAPPQRGGGYRRSSGGLLGALIVTVLAVVAFVGIRALIAPEESAQVPTVDWEAQVRAGRGDEKLLVSAPARLPDGWRATSAAYTTGSEPAWQLGLLTADEGYVGVYERLDDIDDLVSEHIDEDAEQGDDVQIDGVTWQVWTDRGGDYALAREVEMPVGEPGSLLVGGSAAEDDVRALAESLRPTS